MQVAALVEHFLGEATTAERYSGRRGAAFGLAGLVKGLGISALKKHGIMDGIKSAMDVKSPLIAKEGALMAVECLCGKLGRMFEPYIITFLPSLLAAFGDPKEEVRPEALLRRHPLLPPSACTLPCPTTIDVEAAMPAPATSGLLPPLPL